MPLHSDKFKLLEAAARLLPSGVVPPYVELGETGRFDLDLDLRGRTWILRSALMGEAGPKSLLSGKSISIPGLKSLDSIQKALSEVRNQSGLDEVILQEEIHWDRHHTVLIEDDFLLVETRTASGTNHFSFRSKIGSGGEIEVLDQLNQKIEVLRPLIANRLFYLAEWGEKNGEHFLFQLQPVDRSLVQQLFSGDIAGHVVASRHRFGKSNGLLGLLKMEWAAHRFRLQAKGRSFSPALVFENWEFLFHYFRLFCMFRKLSPTGDAFAAFLSDCRPDSFPGVLAIQHIRLAGKLREDEAFPALSFSMGVEMRFIGRGVVEGVVGVEVRTCDLLSLELVYQDPPAKVIMSSDVSVLSHPVLAAVERGTQLVLGASEELLHSFVPGQRVIFDFEKRQIHLK